MSAGKAKPRGGEIRAIGPKGHNSVFSTVGTIRKLKSRESPAGPKTQIPRVPSSLENSNPGSPWGSVVFEFRTEKTFVFIAFRVIKP